MVVNLDPGTFEPVRVAPTCNNDINQFIATVAESSHEIKTLSKVMSRKKAIAIDVWLTVQSVR